MILAESAFSFNAKLPYFKKSLCTNKPRKCRENHKKTQRLCASVVNIFFHGKRPTLPNQFDLTIEKIICTNRIRNGAPTKASAVTERDFESFLLKNPTMPSNTASGAKTQAAKSVMLFKELKVSGEMFN